ncbi:hypothetical protein [Geodermatophilus sp. DF01-2]|uniref:hypothetical protein n=1 Tax=Geodermatophilus sp. DF01-2 TaxID=2559610 RepID=UPI001ADD8610|nr:hypothetical protein [Geodermatophilus sp. DF01_2]
MARGRAAGHERRGTSLFDGIVARGGSGRPLPEVVAARTDVDVRAVLAAGAPGTGEAGAQVDAALAEHTALTEGHP